MERYSKSRTSLIQREEPQYFITTSIKKINDRINMILNSNEHSQAREYLQSKERYQHSPRSLRLQSPMPLNLKKIDSNSLIQRRTEQETPNRRRHEAVIIKGKNIDEEIIKIQAKMAELKKVKEELGIETQVSKMVSETKEDDGDICIPKLLKARKTKRKRKEIDQQKQDKQNMKKPMKIEGQTKHGANSTIKTEASLFRDLTNLNSPLGSTRSKCQSQQFFYQQDHGELARFLKEIKQQIALDYQFRKNKQWFSSLNDRNKWALLDAELLQSGVFISSACTKLIFTLSENQYNPFLGRMIDGGLSQLVSAFIECEAHWMGSLEHRFDRNLLIKEGFTEDAIDIGSKGQVQLQDLIRYVNYEENTIYRGRDMFLIYDRVRKSDKLKFQELLNVFSC